MKIIIHKGSQEIGGTCIQLSINHGTILLDVGQPLRDATPPIDLKDPKIDGLIISHPHQDDFGWMEAVGPNVVCSSQNVDRLVSAYRACMRTGKILVIDFTAWVLEKVKNVSRSVPTMEWDRLRLFADFGLDKLLKENGDFFGDFLRRVCRYRVRKEELRQNPSHYLWVAKMSKYGMIRSYRSANPVNVIYSQWNGYIGPTRDGGGAAIAFAALRRDPQVNFVFAHTSGHATLEDLKKFAAAMSPRKLVPIHTENAEKYCQNFDNVECLADGRPYEI